jgi:hypothetical protein
MQKDNAEKNPTLTGLEKSEPFSADDQPRDWNDLVRQQVELVTRNLTAEPLIPKEPTETGL